MHPLLYLSAAILAVVCAVRSWWARPSIGTWTGAILAALAGAGAGLWTLPHRADLERRSKAYYVGIPVEPLGKHRLSLKPVEGVSGLHVEWVGKGERRDFKSFGEHPPPFPLERIREAGWKVLADGKELHVHDGRCGCSSLDDLADTLHGDPKEVLVEYEATAANRAVLQELELRVDYPSCYGNDLAAGGCFVSIVAIAGWATALIALVGLLILFFRARGLSRSGRPSASPRPAS